VVTWLRVVNVSFPAMNSYSAMTGLGVRRAKAALFQWMQIPPGDMLQPEATGATMEVTKWLKPSGIHYSTSTGSSD